MGLVRIRRGIDAWRAKNNIKRRVQRRALTNNILDKYLSCITPISRYHKHLRALLSVAKHAGLRSNNYVVNGQSSHIKIRDIHFVPNITNPIKILINIPQSKTNQPGSGEEEVRELHKRIDEGPCPVELLRSICVGRMTQSNDPVFEVAPSQGFSYHEVSQVLTILAKGLGLDPQIYTSHALRIGGATDEHKQGKTLVQIQKQFNWKSKKSALRYIRPFNPDEAILKV